MRVILTCGGTAGHINPALAVAKTLEERHPGTEVLFIGAAGDSMESRLVPKAGYRLEQVNINSFRRGLHWEALGHNLKAVRNLSRSRRQVGKLLDEFRPDLVVGTGGFASYPAVREAARRGIPTAIHESNAVPGLTTKRLAGHVDRVMVGLPDPAAGYPHPERVVVTGTPVRPEFFTLTRREAREALGLRDEKPLVLSYWGSLGAPKMNGQMAEFLTLCAQKGCPFRHIHGAGREDYAQGVREEMLRRGVDPEAYPELSVRGYVYDMPRVMAAADVVLCRAGASTISELIALAKPAVLVPSPNVTNDHQTKNARLLSDHGGGILLPEGTCTPQRLWEETTGLLNDPERRRTMGRALSQLAPVDAAERIYQTLMELLR